MLFFTPTTVLYYPAQDALVAAISGPCVKQKSLIQHYPASRIRTIPSILSYNWFLHVRTHVVVVALHPRKRHPWFLAHVFPSSWEKTRRQENRSDENTIGIRQGDTACCIIESPVWGKSFHLMLFRQWHCSRPCYLSSGYAMCYRLVHRRLAGVVNYGSNLSKSEELTCAYVSYVCMCLPLPQSRLLLRILFRGPCWIWISRHVFLVVLCTARLCTTPQFGPRSFTCILKLFCSVLRMLHLAW